MVSPILDVALTDRDLIELRAMPDEIAAVSLDNRLRALESIWKRCFLERGIVLLEMEQRMLWKKLTDPASGEPYTSMESWIMRAAPQSRSDAYAALRAVKDLRDIPRQHLEAVPRCNVSILQSLSTAVRNDPEVLKAAKDLPEREFIRKIQQDWPNQHIEERRLLHMKPTKSASVVIETAIRRAMVVEGVTAREQALEAICVEYLQGHAEVEDEHANDRESIG